MKTKTKVLWIAAIAIILTAAVLLTIFLVKTKDKKDDTPVTDTLSDHLMGNWIVTQSEDRYVGNQMWSFEKEKVSCYEQGSAEPKLTSAYRIGDTITTPNGTADTVVLSDMNKTMAYEKLTDDCIKLTDTATMNSRVLLKTDFDAKGKAALDGNWKVVLHACTKVVGETMTFENGQLHFSDGKREVDSPCSMENGTLTALKLTFDVYKLSDDRLAFVQQSDGRVWIVTSVS